MREQLRVLHVSEEVVQYQAIRAAKRAAWLEMVNEKGTAIVGPAAIGVIAAAAAFVAFFLNQ